MDKTIHSIHTSCKSCVFAKYENITQIGCELDYINKYKNNNIEILEAYDESKEFYIINDKKCIGYREQKWFDQFGDKANALEDKIQIYNSLNFLDYLSIINIKNISPDNLNNLCKKIMDCNIKPKKIIFIRYSGSGDYFSYAVIEKIIKQNSMSFPWKIETILDSSMEYDEILHNITMSNTKYRFIFSINNTEYDVCKIINFADNLVHRELGQFLILSNDSKDCVLYTGGMYRFAIANNQYIFDNNNNYTFI